LKHAELHTFIKSLNKSDVDRILLLVGATQKSTELVSLFSTLRSLKIYSGSELEKRLKLSGKALTRRMNLLSTAIFEAFGQIQGDLKLNNLIEASRRLVMESENKAAESVIVQAFQIANKTERFDLVLELWELIEILPQKLNLRGDSELVALAKQQLLLGYRTLDRRLKALKEPNCTQSFREQTIAQVQDSALMSSPNYMDSVRIECSYLKVKSSLCIFQRDLEESLMAQRKLIELLKENPWVNSNSDFFLVRQYSKFLLLLQETGRRNELEKSLINSPLKANSLTRVENQKVFALYFQRLEIAIQNNDKESGYQIIENYLKALRTIQEFGSFARITLDLYYAAYFYFIHQDWVRAKEILQELAQIPRSRFGPQTLPMSRLLSILVDMETDDLDSFETKIVNLRKAAFYRESRYFKLVLSRLSRLMKSNDLNRSVILQGFFDDYQVCKRDHDGLLYDIYFHFEAWILSKLKPGTMAEYAPRSTANDSENNSQTV
jgi:hypothetical protein